MLHGCNQCISFAPNFTTWIFRELSACLDKVLHLKVFLPQRTRFNQKVKHGLSIPSFHFKNEACHQCKDRNQEWIWIGCITSSTAVEWIRVDPKTLSTKAACRKLSEVTGLSGLEFSKHIEEIPLETATLTMLTYLDLQSCNLVALPNWIGQLTRLERINLNCCEHLELLQWEILLRMPALGYVNCSNCPKLLQRQQECKEQWQNNALTLHRNRTICFRLLSSWTLKIHADVDYLPQWITDLKEYIISINLDGCSNLLALPHWLGLMTRLTQISANCCLKLASIPDSLLSISRLQTAAFFNCPRLQSPPQEILAQGGEATIKFLRMVQRDGQFSKGMALFLIGDGEAGKTSTIMALKSSSNRAQHIRNDHRTVGIDISNWEPAGAEVSFLTFDLAGQAVYSKTHQYFLLRRAIYVFVWRPLIGALELSKLSRTISYWLDSLQNQVPGAYVILVATHIDLVDRATLIFQGDKVRETVQQWTRSRQASADRLNIEILHVAHDGNSLGINCHSGEGVAVLRDTLIEQARSVPWYNELLPASWIRLKDALQKQGRRQYCVLWNEYKEIADSCGVKNEMVRFATRFLHDAGVLRYFGNNLSEKEKSGQPLRQKNETSLRTSVMDDTVYISLEWIINIMKGLVRHDRQALTDYFVTSQNKEGLRRINLLNVCGILHQDLLQFLWPETAECQTFWKFVRNRCKREKDLWTEAVISSREDCERAVALLEGFDLHVKQGTEYLVPGVLPLAKLQHLPSREAKECPFRAKFTYNTLPPGAFETAVVRIAKLENLTVECSSCLSIFSHYIDNPAAIDKAQEPVPSKGGRELSAIIQMFCYEESGPASDFSRLSALPRGPTAGRSNDCLVLRSSDMNLFQKAKNVVLAVESFFGGLIRLNVDDAMYSGPNFKPLNVWEPSKRSTLLSSIACVNCADNHERGQFDRDKCLEKWNEYRPAPLIPSDKIECPKCFHEFKLFDLLSKLCVPESRKCPCCLEHYNNPEGDQQVGILDAGLCRLRLCDDDAKRMKTVTCITCILAGRLGLIRIRDVVPAEVFASGLSNVDERLQGIEDRVLKKIEWDCDVICRFPQSRLPRNKKNAQLHEQLERLQSLQDSTVILFFLSDASVTSETCAEEFRVAANSCKRLVPILMPRSDDKNDKGLSFGWTGPRDANYWRHASSIGWTDGRNNVNWAFLGNFEPISIPLESDWISHFDPQRFDSQVVDKIRVNAADVMRKAIHWSSLDCFTAGNSQLLNFQSSMQAGVAVSDIILKYLRRPGKVEAYNAYSKCGLRLSYFEIFIAQCGGRQGLADLTTTDVMQKFVKSRTHESNLAFCEWLLSDSPNVRGRYVDTAEWFYSHAWQFEFLDVVDAAKLHFKDVDPFIWFDVFSVSQHNAESRPFEWWNVTFLNAVGDIGKVLMLMQPFETIKKNKVTPAWTTLTRVWCVFELYACESTNSHLEITMTKAMHQKMIARFTQNSDDFFRTLAGIKCQNCTANKNEDQERIFEVIHRTIGFPLLNAMVTSIVEKWLYSELRIHMKQEIESKTQLLNAMITFCKAFMVKRIQTSGLGKEHPYTQGSIHTLAELYQEQGLSKEAATRKASAEAWEAYSKIKSGEEIAQEEMMDSGNNNDEWVLCATQ